MMLRRAIIRLMLVIAPRAAVTMTGAGEAVGYETRIHDLRGALPERADIHYSYRPESDVRGIVLHHSATTGQSIRSIAQYHTEHRGWPAIAYSFAIGWDGIVYQTNDVTMTAYHASGFNRHTIGVVLIGNYHEREMTDEMKASLLELVGYLGDTYNIEYVWLHRETKATACPGRYATEFMTPYLFGPRPKR